MKVYIVNKVNYMEMITTSFIVAIYKSKDDAEQRCLLEIQENTEPLVSDSYGPYDGITFEVTERTVI